MFPCHADTIQSRCCPRRAGGPAGWRQGGGLMRMLRSAVWMFPVGLMVLGAGAVSAQNYPNKPIRIVTAAPGSNNDWGARLVAQELTPRVGQRVIVENRGSISVEYVAKDAPADGYTLL